MQTTLKAAAAPFAAIAVLAGAAFAAESEPTVNSGALLEKIYRTMDKERTQTSDTVLTSAQTRVDDQLQSLEERAEPALAITLASNDAN